ncbi:MAG: tetratricopeptide repeat protein [Steroidobacteraceae bacterium]
MRLNPGFCALLLALLAPLAQAIPDANGNLIPPDAPNLADDPAMSARLNYNLGFERFEKTQQLEAKAGAPADVRQGYTEAREKFRKAAAADPGMKEAWNMVGYTSRRVGDYTESLSAYETALKLQPEYPEAIEYLAELYLLTGRLDDAKASFAKLVKLSPSYANVLLQAMRDWIAAPVRSPAAFTTAQRDAFAKWVSAQKAAS